MKPGDIILAFLPKYKHNPRPCVLLENTGTKYKVLPITHNNKLNESEKLPISLDYFRCCIAITGFLNFTTVSVPHNRCLPSNICNCEASVILKYIIKLYYGIDL